MATRKAHAIEERWSTGGFHVERYIKCRCGEVFTHYNAGEVLKRFREHQSMEDVPSGDH